MYICFMLVFSHRKKYIRKKYGIFFDNCWLLTSIHSPPFPIHTCYSQRLPSGTHVLLLSWLYITGVCTGRFHSIFYKLSVKVVDADTPDLSHIGMAFSETQVCFSDRYIWPELYQWNEEHTFQSFWASISHS